MTRHDDKKRVRNQYPGKRLSRDGLVNLKNVFFRLIYEHKSSTPKVSGGSRLQKFNLKSGL